MKAIPATFRQGGFDYRVLQRQGRVVLVQKTKPNLPGPMFEVAVLRIVPEFTFPGKATAPEHEAMPRDQYFGTTAWDFAYSRERAEAAFARMAPEAYTDAEDGDPDGGGAVLIPPDDQNHSLGATVEQQTAFQRLPSTWVDAGWRFRLLKRSGMVVLLAKSKAGRDHYEVAIVQRHKAHTWPNGEPAPARESMPGDEEWGTYGWSPFDLPSAEAKFAQVVASQSTP